MSENGDFIGGFGKIGYEMDETTTFKYESNIAKTATTAVASTDDAWKATSKTALNDCAKGAIWSLKIDPSTSGNGLKWTAQYKSPAVESKCSILTPRFTDLTRGS